MQEYDFGEGNGGGYGLAEWRKSKACTLPSSCQSMSLLLVLEMTMLLKR